MANRQSSNGRHVNQQGQYFRSAYSRNAYQQPSGQRAPQGRSYEGYSSQQPAGQRASQGLSYGGNYGQQQNPYQQQTAYQRPVNAQQQRGRQVQGGNSGYARYGGQMPSPAPKKKGHPVLIVVVVILVVLIGVGGFAAYTGTALANSAKIVKSDASAVMTDISNLKDQVFNEQAEAANATARDIVNRAENMKKETSGWAWDVASKVPVYGSDVQIVKDLADVLYDLGNGAVVPLVAEATQVSMSSLISPNGDINVEQAQRLINALDNAAPAINACAAKIEKMPDAHLEQINEPLQKAKESIDGLGKVTQFVDKIAPTFSQMLGADGQPRTYLIVAQSNSEIRSTGGFPGSIGPLYINNGHIEMGDFRTILEMYPNYLGWDDSKGYQFESYDENVDALSYLVTSEEEAVFGVRLVRYLSDANFIPDWSRVGEIYSAAWEMKGFGPVQGVIGVDPVFLQDLLAVTGTSVNVDGEIVDGSNAARLLLHDAYYLPLDKQDPFFETVAASAFQGILNGIGNVSFVDLASVLGAEIENRRFMVWMANPDEEEAMETIGADAKLPHDETQPTVGFYIDDESFSKIFWYLKIESQIGEGVKNADGSMTYPVIVTWRNMLPSLSELSSSMLTNNIYRRSDGDMLATVLLSAPEGGRISDVWVEGYFTPEDVNIRDDGGAKHGDGMTETTLQGLDFWYGLSQTLPGEANAIHFNVTTSPNATEPLKFIRTATAQEVAGW